MEFDQLLYKGVLRLIQKIREKPPDQDRLNRTAYLSALKPRLLVLARLLNKTKITIHTAEDIGGWKDNTFFLPASYHHGPAAEDNVAFYLCRIAFLSVQRQLNHNWTDGEHTEAESIAQAGLQAEKVLTKLFKEFPAMEAMVNKLTGIERQWQLQHNGVESMALLWGKWMYSTSLARDSKVGMPADHAVRTDESKSKITEREAPARENLQVLSINKQEQEQYNLTHNFEKIETLQEFSGNWRDFDGSNELEEHAEALDDLNLRNLVRVDNPVHSIYRSEFVHSSGISESADATAAGYLKCYDEWNYKAKAYRKDYCKLHIRKQTEQAPAYAKQALQNGKSMLVQMRKQFAAFYNSFLQVRRQAAGKSPDIDALTEVFADLKAGKTTTQNVYTDERRLQKDIAMLLLMDVSLSTDGYAGGHRILDIEKQSLILAGEVFSEYGVDFQVDGFSSRTRNNCDYIPIKSFNDSWATGRSRLGAVEPCGYTRIGPAIRHAAFTLQNTSARHKWLLILSDGKPNDYDQYEGRYGIEDVRKAVAEARRHNVSVSAMAIDVSAKFYLPHMLGPGGYKILSHPAQLPAALLSFYKNVLKR